MSPAALPAFACCASVAKRHPSRRNIWRWVADGGVLVAFRTAGLHDLFGITGDGPAEDVPPFSVVAWMDFEGRDEAAHLRDPALPHVPCPIMAPFRRVDLRGVVSLADLVSEGASPCPGVTRHDLGRGRACYFAFDLPRAVWTYHQGRPIVADADGDGFLRYGDALIVRDADVGDLPWADLLLLLLERLLAPAGVPFVDLLPPVEGCVPDALFHYGGDDEARAGLQRPMSDAMAALGLPYHLNVMLGKNGSFHFSDEDAAHGNGRW